MEAHMDGMATSFQWDDQDDHATAFPGHAAERSGTDDLPSYLSQLEQPSEQLRGCILRHTGELLATLLDLAPGEAHGSSPTLRPLWAEEAMHRAHAFLKLAPLLEHRALDSTHIDLVHRLELIVATDLAGHYHRLVASPEREVLPCSGPLREIARDLVSLFGGAVGGVELGTDIERVGLPGYKRRALVLAASELILNALRHGFSGPAGGQLIVSLRLAKQRQGRLVVADDGMGCGLGAINVARGIAGGLADLLEGTLRYRAQSGVGVIAEIAFPISG
jgi:hypothetical protein